MKFLFALKSWNADLVLRWKGVADWNLCRCKWNQRNQREFAPILLRTNTTIFLPPSPSLSLSLFLPSLSLSLPLSPSLSLSLSPLPLSLSRSLSLSLSVCLSVCLSLSLSISLSWGIVIAKAKIIIHNWLMIYSYIYSSIKFCIKFSYRLYPMPLLFSTLQQAGSRTSHQLLQGTAVSSTPSQTWCLGNCQAEC